MRYFALILMLLALAPSADAAKPFYSCAVTTAPAADLGYIELHVTGTVPNRAVPYLRVDGSQSWTALHNQKGVIDDYTTRTSGELPSGTHTADLIDMAQSDLTMGFVFVGATCIFTT